MKKWIYRILLVVCLCVFGYSAYNLWDIYSQKQQVENETKQLETSVIRKKDKEEKQVLDPDWSKLKAENQDIVAWIYVPGCDISFPVVQTKDNQYYLNHTVGGEYNDRGSIFLDANANGQFQDDNSIIYGHSVEGGGSVFYTTSFGDYRHQTLDSMQQMSTYFNELDDIDANYVSLSTCDLEFGFNSNHRFVLTGLMEKTSDDIVLKD